VDAINALVVGTQDAQFLFDRAASKIAATDLPESQPPPPNAPLSAVPNFGIDPAELLTTMMVAADTHHITTAALRVALDVYQDSTEVGASNP